MQQLNHTQLRAAMLTLSNKLRQLITNMWAAHEDRIRRRATDRRVIAVFILLALSVTLAMRGAPADTGNTHTLAKEGPKSALQENAVDPKDAPEAGIVVCLGVVLDQDGMEHGFLQGAGQTLDQVFTDMGKTTLVSEGFTVRHRYCYESWQDAADFMMDGEVTLPRNTTAESFMLAYFEWKASKQ
ncbi:MAG: hypothetical protein KDJ52_04935 [Anaerolineae bacterium]|nr:hypothetical protein [Anaerolineae bacterium]